MNVIDRNTTGVFEKAVRLYESGDSRGALDLLSSRGDHGNPQILALMANANLKLGQAEPGADLFARLADLIEAKRSFFLKSAATLYLRSGAVAKLAEIGARTIRANPTDSRLAFDILKVMNAHEPTEVIEPLLDHLNKSDPEQVYFVSSFYRDRKKDFERSYLALVEGIKNAPNDGFLRVQQFAGARIVCDFTVMRSFEEMMHAPRSTYAEQIFLNQMALDRLYWSDDERQHAEPTHNVSRLDGVRAGNRGPRRRRPISPAPDRLRVGYLSNDFGNEVVLTVFRPVLERHDASKFDITLFCYSNAEARKFQENWPEALRARIVSIADLSDEAAADVISAAKIDVLVDLKGHTKGDRLRIMNITNAPVTATYLGYPGSVFGADIDYLISDITVTPDTSKPHYNEKLCRLPEVQMPNKALAAEQPAAKRRSDWGLPEDRFVFASFNGQQKITPRTFDLWCRILGSVPNSVLWIACNNALAARNLIAEFGSAGIAEERIIFNQKTPRSEDHIARLALADLVLDTLPYNGHSTTADMLRAGLPVLTVKGKSYHSRVSWSLLESCGIGELATESDEDYCQMAERLAGDPGRLGEIRGQLRENRKHAPLFNPERMARHLERAYEMMADRAREGLPPDHIDVPALPV